jgi:hypothetical protein
MMSEGAPGTGERAVDGKPQILEIHPGILPDPESYAAAQNAVIDMAGRSLQGRS